MIKNLEELNGMRKAGSLAAEVLEMIGDFIKPGISTGELDKICYDYIVDVQRAIPANIGYRGFEKTLCTSINQVICHGIPDDSRILKSGDIMNIDVTVIKDGYHGDTSKMYAIGNIKPHAEKLIKITQESMYKGIEIVRPGIKFGDIGYAIQKHAEGNHYSVVRDYCGHGIGANFHEDPQVLHYGTPNTGTTLEEGMCFTIEPMLNLGSHKTKLSKRDGWTVETLDGRLSAQWEHTILVTSDGFEILTKRSNENF